MTTSLVPEELATDRVWLFLVVHSKGRLKTAISCKWKWIICGLNGATSHERLSWRWATLKLDDEPWARLVELWTGRPCLCSYSFHMCQWRRWFPDDSDFWSSSCTSVLIRWVSVEIGGCSLQCRPPPSWAVSRTEAVCMKCVWTRLTRLCPLSTFPLSSSLSGLQGWDRRLRWSFRLVISSF